jgi:hypothetical protein
MQVSSFYEFAQRRRGGAAGSWKTVKREVVEAMQFGELAVDALDDGGLHFVTFAWILSFDDALDVTKAVTPDLEVVWRSTLRALRKGSRHSELFPDFSWQRKEQELKDIECLWTDLEVVARCMTEVGSSEDDFVLLKEELEHRIALRWTPERCVWISTVVMK